MIHSTPLSDDGMRLQAILNTAVDAIVTIDDRGIIQTVNQAAERCFGYSAAELIGQNVSVLMPNPYRDEHQQYLRSYLHSGQRKIIGIGREVVGRRRDGSVFPLDLAVSEIRLGDRLHFAGIMRDITARKREEAERAHLGHVLEESLNEIYFFSDATWRYTWANRIARENTGYSLSELVEMTPVDLIPELVDRPLGELLHPLRDGQREMLVFDALQRRKNGSHYDVEVRVQRSELQERSVFVAIVLDVTVRKEADRALNRLNAELEQRVQERSNQLEIAQAELVRKERLATLGHISGSIAHEIRNPLNAVKTSAYYLLNAQDPSPEKLIEHLQRIDRQVTLANNVITALSEFARLPDASPEAVSIHECLVGAIEAAYIPTEIRICLEIEPDIPPVIADGPQLTIAMRNLLSNARDAMPDGGSITVSAHRSEGRISIAIIDEGTGIERDIIDRIMDPLFSTKSRGIGLGLAITRSIVERNQGELHVRSEPGKGSEFTMLLKAAE